MSSLDDSEGRYTLLLKATHAEVRPFFFSGKLIELLRRTPGWEVQPNRLSRNKSFIQQYVMARGPSEEPALMVILAHLVTLSPNDQDFFSKFELPSGRISGESANAILFGEWPSSDSFILALANVLDELNSMCPPHGLFRMHGVDTLSGLSLLLPIPQNSRNAFQESVSELYKILVDELEIRTIDLEGIPTEDETGNRLGTLGRLWRYLRKKGVREVTVANLKRRIGQLSKIRGTKSHVPVAADTDDRDYMYNQDQLFRLTIETLRILCIELGKSVHGNGWTPPLSLQRPVRPLHLQDLR